MTLRHVVTPIAAVLGLVLSFPASAGLINLVVNGEFENTDSNPRRWTATGVDGWESSEGRIEIWNENFQWGDRLGSDGERTGQHAEITWNTDKASIWTELTIPEWFGGSVGQFRFDYQNRSARGLWASVVRPDAAPQEFYVTSSNAWALLDEPIAGLNAGDVVTLMFRSDGGRSMGAHIDQVEFLIDGANDLRRQGENASVPAPGTVALLALGAGMLGWRRRSAAHGGWARAGC